MAKHDYKTYKTATRKPALPPTSYLRKSSANSFTTPKRENSLGQHTIVTDLI